MSMPGDMVNSLTAKIIDNAKAVPRKNVVKPDTSPNNTEDDRIKAACSEFESLFLYQLFKNMRATVPESGLLGDGKSQEIYTDMMDTEVSKKLAASGGIGLSALLFQQMQKQQTDGVEKSRATDDLSPSGVMPYDPEKKD
ncbi:MAG: hypothetical protein HKM93_07660 [Desulfobacteraceae bacterium]|nr:hypothetical protein [Desulfobacteraceae bacterium]